VLTVTNVQYVLSLAVIEEDDNSASIAAPCLGMFATGWIPFALLIPDMDAGAQKSMYPRDGLAIVVLRSGVTYTPSASKAKKVLP